MHRLSAEHGVFGADELDALNKTPQQVSSVRSRLLRESIIEAPSYGKVSFAIPYMRDYLYEHKAELEVEL